MAIREDGIYKGVKYWIRPNIENRIKEGSITAYFNTEVKEIRENEVVLEGPDGVFTIENDFVLAMTGYKPNYELLHHLGLEIPDDEDQIPVHDAETLETSLPNVYIAGVVCAGMKTSKLFIENTRDHGEIIINQIRKKKSLQEA
jgi:thioredoxin reductase (NADPH)